MGLIQFARNYLRSFEAAVAEERARIAPPPARAPQAPRSPGAHGPRVRVATLDESALRVLDLRHLDPVRTRIRGSAYVVKDSERATFGGDQYLLVREPDNRADPQAVAVYGRGRRVGYLSSAKAAAISPLLRESEWDAFRVGGGMDSGGGIRLWIDLPRLPALRAALRA